MVASVIRQINNLINNKYLNRISLKTTHVETTFIKAKSSLGSNE